jgi:hypothetical protein
MHRRLCEQLLAEEVAVANGGALRRRLIDDVRLDATRALVAAEARGCPMLFAFDGTNYNAEPLGLSVIDPSSHEPLPAGEWPEGLCGGEHPSLHRPFACLRGLYEYHVHFSHLQDTWDLHRYALRFDVVVGHVLNRAGVPA